jgi:hypothetical protein
MLRVPRDINLDSSIKSVPMSGESPKADKPLTPNTEKSMLGSSKPPSLGGAQTPLALVVLLLLSTKPLRAQVQ